VHATVNPTVTTPPETTQDGEEVTLWGAEMIEQLVSDEKPVADPVTNVPIGPDGGVRVRILIGPDIAAKFAVAESPAPPFV
jgi:hypothetical protein